MEGGLPFQLSRAYNVTPQRGLKIHTHNIREMVKSNNRVSANQ